MTSRCRPVWARPRETRSGLVALFADCDLDGSLDLIVVNGHIDETVRNIRGTCRVRAGAALVSESGRRALSSMRRPQSATRSLTPRVGRGLAFGDFDCDGDLDFLLTTNGGAAVLCRNDQLAGNRGSAVPPRRHQVESRCDRRNRANLPRGHLSVPDGEERIELSLPVRVAGNLRRRAPRSRRSRRRRLAYRKG